MNKPLTFEWLRDLVMILTFLGAGVGVYINLNGRVVAAEERISSLTSTLEDYKDVPIALARIEEGVYYIRRELDNQKKSK